MFKKLTKKLAIKNMEYVRNTAYESLKSCKAILYDIEHEQMEDFEKDCAIKLYGSIDEYKKHYEEVLEKSKIVYEKYLKDIVEFKLKS